MSENYLHEKENNLNKLYLLALSFLIAFGFYKNGILVFKEFSDNYVMLFKPLLFPIISITVSCFFEYIFNKKIKVSDNILFMILLSMIIPVNTNLLIFLILCLLFNFSIYFVFDKIDLKLNYVALFKLILILILLIINKYNYANNLEVIKKYSYDLLDIFIGRGVSGVASSSILFSLLGYFILCLNKYYKNEIPLISFSIYFLFVLLFKVVFNHVIVLNSMIIFTLIFIAPINNFSPAIKKERIIYSIILGILTFICTYFINMYDGVIIALLISSGINYINIK